MVHIHFIDICYVTLHKIFLFIVLTHNQVWYSFCFGCSTLLVKVISNFQWRLIFSVILIRTRQELVVYSQFWFTQPTETISTADVKKICWFSAQPCYAAPLDKHIQACWRTVLSSSSGSDRSIA